MNHARQPLADQAPLPSPLNSGMMFLSTGIPASVTLCTFGAFVFVQKESLTASTAFTAMSLFSLLREAVSEWKDRCSSFRCPTRDHSRLTRSRYPA